MAQATDVCVTMLPVISGGGMHDFFVPANKLIVIDGATFVRLDKCANTTFCLMGCRRHHHGGYFHIIDVLITLRNAAMFNHTNIVVGRECEAMDDADTAVLNLIRPSDSVSSRRRKRNLRGLLPEVLRITAPSIDGGDGFNMRVACPDRTTSPVAVELTTDNIRYLRMAAQKWTAPPQNVHERRARMLAPKGVVHHKGVVRDTYNKRILCRVHVDTGRTRTKVFKIDKFPTEIDAAARAAEFMSAVPPTIIELDSQTQPTESSEPLVES